MSYPRAHHWIATIMWLVVLASPLVPAGASPRLETPPREFDFGNRYFARGDFETAIAFYKEALEENAPGEWSSEALYLTARSLEELGRSQLADRTYRAVVDTYPRSPWADDALFHLGRHRAATLNRKGSQAALAVFRELLETYPDGDRVLDAQVQSGTLHYLMGNWSRAEQIFKDVRKQKPSPRIDGEAQFGLGQVYSHPSSPARNLLQAIGYFKEVTQIEPPHPQAAAAQFAIGAAFRDLKLYRRAIESFQAVIQGHPGSLFAPLAQTHLALCAAEEKEYAQDLQALQGMFRERTDPADRLAEDLARLAGGAADGKKLRAAADSVVHDQEQRIVHYRGNVEILHEGLLIRADQADVDLGSRRITASGGIQLLRGDGLRLVGDQLRLDLRSREVQVEGSARLITPDRPSPPIRECILFDLSLQPTPGANRSSQPGTDGLSPS